MDKKHVLLAFANIVEYFTKSSIMPFADDKDVQEFLVRPMERIVNAKKSNDPKEIDNIVEWASSVWYAMDRMTNVKEILAEYKEQSILMPEEDYYPILRHYSIPQNEVMNWDMLYRLSGEIEGEFA